MKIENGKTRKYFSWKVNIEAYKILKAAVEDGIGGAMRIRTKIHKAGIQPLPTIAQIKTRLNYVRPQMRDTIPIKTIGDIRKEVLRRVDVPKDEHQPYINNWNILSDVDGNNPKFMFNITTKHLKDRLLNNPLKLFHLDPTYKLNEHSCPTMVHGTSNSISEFFPTGLCVGSHDDADTFKRIMQAMEVTEEFDLREHS